MRRLGAPYTVLALSCGFACIADGGWASSTKTIYTFHGARDGGNPEAGLLLGTDGVLYGTADRGGGAKRNSGTIYSFTPPATAGGNWTRQVLYRFTGGDDGGYPLGLTMDQQGNLYGYALTSKNGLGLVFRLKKPATEGKHWLFRTLYQFQGGTDGEYPNGLAVQPDGTLIGATSHGGTGPCRFPGDSSPAGCGTVFQLSPGAHAAAPWSETVLYRFAGRPDGALPNGAPVLIDGALWGVAVQGGNGSCIDSGSGDLVGCGVVYKLTQDAPGSWSASVQYSFLGGANGWGPIAGVAADRNGALYGVTAFGGDTGTSFGNGVVYQLVPSGGDGLTQNVIHTFKGSTDGRGPQGGVIVTSAGKVYGTTEFGPDGYFGTVFALAQRPGGSGNWVESILAKFASPGGVYSMGNIVRDQLGAIYGVTYQGGRFDQGTLYKAVE